MSDRVLLEAAARAAGIALLDWCDNWSDYGPAFRTLERKCWNPLTDDGDALRLAVKLRMAMDVGEYGLVAFCGQGLDREVKQEDIDGDPYSSTRRAIVRAAAALADVPPNVANNRPVPRSG